MNSLDFALNTSIPSAQLDFDHTDLTFYATDWVSPGFPVASNS